MLDEPSTAPSVIRLATPDDIEIINQLDQLSTSPLRNIPRDMEKYFGSVDPTTHEQTLIFLVQVGEHVAGKAELMIPLADILPAIGYVKRVMVSPAYRNMGLARQLMQHIITYAQTELHLAAIDLHVWEQNLPAIRLYETLGFELQHRELYFRLPL